MNPKSWDEWIKYFEEKGYTCHAPAYGYHIGEPNEPIENDPDLTDKKFPRNPTMTYRSTHPFKADEEITIWQGHPTEQVKAMKYGIP
ncbi:MAG: NAD(+)--rifampin ADP-ribosyltransferase [Bacteroidota bacterium]|nr:NAD(+)--rifampin ADP-ribosyltransferase [Bacteroidota bacterium]